MSYSGILFYTVGNVVYRLDFKQSGGKATPVYTHAGGKATMMNLPKRLRLTQIIWILRIMNLILIVVWGLFLYGERKM